MKILPTKPIRLPRLRTYVPRPEDPKIFWFNSERDDIVQEVVRRIMERYDDEEAAELALSDCAYNEILRLENATSERAASNLDSWRGLIPRLGRM